MNLAGTFLYQVMQALLVAVHGDDGREILDIENPHGFRYAEFREFINMRNIFNAFCQRVFGKSKNSITCY